MNPYKTIFNAVKKGQEANFEDGENNTKKPIIDGKFIRCLMQQTDLPKKFSRRVEDLRSPFAPAGVRIRGAIIENLDLSNASHENGECCHASILTNCELVRRDDDDRLLEDDERVSGDAQSEEERHSRSLDGRYAKLSVVDRQNCRVQAHADLHRTQRSTLGELWSLGISQPRCLLWDAM